MNREIKYRAWDKKSKKMCSVSLIDTSGLVMIVNPDNKEIEDDGDWELLKNVELMQYIGRVDKNKIPIYEADILKEIVDDEYYTYEVFFDPEYLIFVFIGDDGEFFDIKKIELNDCEIIGSKFENPELLEKQ